VQIFEDQLHSKDAGLHLQSSGEGDQPYGHLQGQSMRGTVSFSLNRLFHSCVFRHNIWIQRSKIHYLKIQTLHLLHPTNGTFILPINGAVNSTYRMCWHLYTWHSLYTRLTLLPLIQEFFLNFIADNAVPSKRVMSSPF
jgi:hypothetical protein